MDLPIVGTVFYRLNVNAPVIGMMARDHVYADPSWLTPERMAGKRAVTESSGARYASFPFATGELDLLSDREAFLDTARRAGERIVVACGSEAPHKSKAEMAALRALLNSRPSSCPAANSSFCEEFPEQAAAAIGDLLRDDANPAGRCFRLMLTRPAERAPGSSCSED